VAPDNADAQVAALDGARAAALDDAQVVVLDDVQVMALEAGADIHVEVQHVGDRIMGHPERWLDYLEGY